MAFLTENSKGEIPCRMFNFFTSSNLKLTTPDKVNIGITIYYPLTVYKDTIYFLFLHGSGCNRDVFYPVFRDNYFGNRSIVGITMNYREFGDSEGIFTKQGVVSDIQTVLNIFTLIMTIQK